MATYLSQVILYGTDAAKPSPTAGLAGRLYFATDTLTVYQDSGTAWTTLFSGLMTTGNIVAEAPTGTIPGNVFTTSNAPKGVIGLYVNGQYIPTSQYSISGTTITLNWSLSAGPPADQIFIVYTK